MVVSQVQNFITEHSLFTKNELVIIAISGGKDSVSLAHALKELDFEMMLAHCNFNLRGHESDGDEAFVRELANDFDCEIVVKHFETNLLNEPGESIQMTARRLRYGWFEELLKEYPQAVLATAHSANDNTETLIYNLTKGTGIKGLRGIAPKLNGLVRPLLSCTSEDILAYLGENQFAYREDSSNDSDKYARNFIRRHVVPKLKEINPSLHQTMANNARHFNDYAAFSYEAIEQIKDDFSQEDSSEIIIDLTGLKKIDGYRSVLIEWLGEYGFNPT
ncbi:MAG: tRNA lysidine(34) synthetase TilS, partial [Bacteroidetes bacterium]|nr:tRNA lysidine(34) synthetase TilS [Bacteroidota bacterium]